MTQSKVFPTICSILLLLSIVTLPILEAEAEPKAEDASLSRIISIDLKDSDISNFLRIIAEVTNMNVIRIDTVSEKVTARLIDIPAERVLDSVLAEHGLMKRIEGNVIKVYRLNSPYITNHHSSKKYTGKLISLDLQDTDMDNALRLFEEISAKKMNGKELLKDSAKVTQRIIDVPWDQALDIILEQKGLTSVVGDTTIRIERLSQE